MLQWPIMTWRKQTREKHLKNLVDFVEVTHTSGNMLQEKQSDKAICKNITWKGKQIRKGKHQNVFFQT